MSHSQALLVITAADLPNTLRNRMKKPGLIRYSF